MLVGSIVSALVSHCMRSLKCYTQFVVIIKHSNALYIHIHAECRHQNWSYKVLLPVFASRQQSMRCAGSFVAWNTMIDSMSMQAHSHSQWQRTFQSSLFGLENFVVGIELRVNTSNMRDTDDNSLRRAKINNAIHSMYSSLMAVIVGRA